MNRLADETSHLQHAENPVEADLGEEALSRAREKGRADPALDRLPACHWCHVMAHESFEDDETAALMNERYVCVKVDREERLTWTGSTWTRSWR